MSFRFRLGTPQDIRSNQALLDLDRHLFEPSLFEHLPSLLTGLMRDKRIRMVTVEEADTGRVRMLGGVGFADPKALSEALAQTDCGLLNGLFRIAARGGQAFLAPRQIARANAEERLLCVDFLGTPDIAVKSKLDDPSEGSVFITIGHAYRFFHQGYRMSEMWHEYANPMARAFMTSAGYRNFRERATGGEPEIVFRFTRQDAVETPGANQAFIIWGKAPKLGFSLAEQELLERALLGEEDDVAAASLGLGPDAVKKRWRSIYRRIESVEPELAPKDRQGNVRRRLLLTALDKRLEEIRPFRLRAAVPSGT